LSNRRSVHNCEGTHCSVDWAEQVSALVWRKLMQNAVAGLKVLTCRRLGIFARATLTLDDADVS
jgi:2-dehydropantoate 2-reductase